MKDDQFWKLIRIMVLGFIVGAAIIISSGL